jgi:hypothetical protein
MHQQFGEEECRILFHGCEITACKYSSSIQVLQENRHNNNDLQIFVLSAPWTDMLNRRAAALCIAFDYQLQPLKLHSCNRQ